MVSHNHNASNMLTIKHLLLLILPVESSSSIFWNVNNDYCMSRRVLDSSHNEFTRMISIYSDFQGMNLTEPLVMLN